MKIQMRIMTMAKMCFHRVITSYGMLDDKWSEDSEKGYRIKQYQYSYKNLSKEMATRLGNNTSANVQQKKQRDIQKKMEETVLFAAIRTGKALKL